MRALLSDNMALATDIRNKAMTGDFSSIPGIVRQASEATNDTRAPLLTASRLSSLSNYFTGSVLQCDGVGGLASLVIGLQKSQIAREGPTTFFFLKGVAKYLVPEDLSYINYDGNHYEFNLREMEASRVNGMNATHTFALLFALHSE